MTEETPTEAKEAQEAGTVWEPPETAARMGRTVQVAARETPRRAFKGTEATVAEDS